MTKDGSFYRALWVPGQGKSRKCIGTKDREEADRRGRELLSALLQETAITESGVLPLGYLWERYQKECTAFLDNDPNTQKNDANHAAVLLGYFGADCDVRELTEKDQQAFVSNRLKGGIVVEVPGTRKKRTTKPVRMRSLEVETQLLHSMLKWAVPVRVRKGQRLLDRNPLEGVKRPHELNPRRPMASVERFGATRQAIQQLIGESESFTDAVRWYQLDLVLVLAEATGRRLGSIRQLEWKDWDFERNSVKWRSESDKKRKEWVVPVPESLIADVRAYRLRCGH